MDGYHVALVIHLLTLVAASSVSAIVHLAESRGSRATTIADALPWHRISGSAARFFPIIIVLLFASGSYMVTAGGGWSWSTGWIDAGIVACVLLLGVGAFIGTRARRGAFAMKQQASQPGGASAAPSHDPLISTLSWSNTGLAMSVVVLMTVKPELIDALGTLVAGMAIGIAYSLTRARGAAVSGETAAG
jgi:hypothetical protein